MLARPAGRRLVRLLPSHNEELRAIFRASRPGWKQSSFFCDFLFPRYTVRSIFHIPAFAFLDSYTSSGSNFRLRLIDFIPRWPCIAASPGSIHRRFDSAVSRPRVVRETSLPFQQPRLGGIVDTNCNDDFYIRNPLVLFSTHGEYQHKSGSFAEFYKRWKSSRGFGTYLLQFPMVPLFLPFFFSFFLLAGLGLRGCKSRTC